jgi:hypothetical protein
MSSPFDMFRRNQKAWMAGLVLIALLSFVVAPMLMMPGSQSPEERQAAQLIAFWRGGELTVGDYQRSARIRGQSMRVIDRLMSELQQSNITPQIPSLTVDNQGQMVVSFDRDTSLQAILNSRLLLQKAHELGIVFDDDAAQEFLRALTGGVITNARFREIMRDEGQRLLSDVELFKFIKEQLAIDTLQQMATAGLAGQSGLNQTPLEAWNQWLKFHRRARIQAYPVTAGDYLGQVTDEPTEAQLRELFEQGKERLPDPGSPEPAFARLYAADFEYVSGVMEDLLPVEIAKLTEEQLRAAYDEQVAAGQLRVPVRSSEADSADSAESMDAEAAAAEADPDAADPDAVDPDAVDPDAADPAGEDSTGTETAEPEPGDQPTSDQQGGLLERSAARLVTFRGESAAQDGPPPVEAPPGLTQPPATEPPATEPPATELGDLDVAAEDSPPAEEPPAERVLTFEEARELLERELAEPAAQRLLQERIDQLEQEMIRFGDQRRLYEAQVEAGVAAKEPTPLSLADRAQELGLRYARTGLIDRQTALDLPLAGSFMFLDGRLETFANYAISPAVELNRPGRSVSFGLDSGGTENYLFWKVEQRPQQAAEFDDVRLQVEDFWRRQQAAELARQSAEQLSVQLNSVVAEPAEGADGDEQLPASSLMHPAWSEALDDDQLQRVLSPTNFTWLQRPPERSFEQPRLSRIEGIDGADWEFMEQIFGRPTDEFFVVPNVQRTAYYVVRVMERFPESEQLQGQFMRNPLQDSVQLARVGYEQAVRAFYFEIAEQYELVFEPSFTGQEL